MAGLAFFFLFCFVLAPLSAVFLFYWLVKKDRQAYRWLCRMWIGVFLLPFVGWIVAKITADVVLTKEDYYGSYSIDRNYFPGPNADWQYNAFRFEITPDDSFHFHLTDGERVIRTISGTIDVVAPNGSARLIVRVDTPGHHILRTPPTVIRDWHGFRLIFNSPFYYSVYFRKKPWKPLG